MLSVLIIDNFLKIFENFFKGWKFKKYPREDNSNTSCKQITSELKINRFSMMFFTFKGVVKQNKLWIFQERTDFGLSSLTDSLQFVFFISFQKNKYVTLIENSLLNYNRFNSNNSFDNFLYG